MIIEIDGIKFLSGQPGKICAKLSKGILYEGEMLRFIKTLNIEGECVDIGACMGVHSMYFAVVLGKKVYAFDKEHELFRTHMSINKVGDKITYIDKYLLPPTKLIDIVSDKIGLIKIDVDGSDEIDVLTSCKEVIERDSPHIFIEARDLEKRDQIDRFLSDYVRLEVFNSTPTYHYERI